MDWSLLFDVMGMQVVTIIEVVIVFAFALYIFRFALGIDTIQNEQSRQMATMQEIMRLLNKAAEEREKAAEELENRDDDLLELTHDIHRMLKKKDVEGDESTAS